MGLTHRASLVNVVELRQCPAEDLEVQCRTDASCWHRRAVGGAHTACGEPLGRDVGSLRHETYLGELCARGCFSSWELEQSRLANEEERRQLDLMLPPAE